MSEIQLRPARLADIPAILQLQFDCYPVLAHVAAWREEHLASHQRLFPEGQFVATMGGSVIGHSASFVTTQDAALKPHTFREITANGTFRGHDPTGDVLYGAEIMVHPDARRRGVAGRIYQERFALAHRLGLAYFAAGGRLPDYAKVRDRIPVEDYVEDVVAGRRTDRVLSAQLRAGLRVHGILPGYLNDPSSGSFATLLVWANPVAPASPRSPPRAPRARSPRSKAKPARAARSPARRVRRAGPR